MATLSIFVSFEYPKDNDLKNNFYQQAKDLTQHRIRNCSLNEAYPDEVWENKAREAIRECDVVVVLIGQDTHNARGVRVETGIAHSLKKPIIQVRPRQRPYRGVPHLKEPIPWRWPRINRELEKIRPLNR